MVLVQKFSLSLLAFHRSEEAASAVEYGLLAALIAAVIITILTQLGYQPKGSIHDHFKSSQRLSPLAIS